MEERTTEQIESELESLRDKRAAKNGELGDAESKAQQIQTLYDTKSVAWHNYGDKDAKRWLDTSDKELFQSQSEVKQLTAAVQDITDRIAKLESDKVEAVRAAIAHEIEDAENALLADCIALDDGIARLITFRNAIYSHRDRLIQLANSAGRDFAFYRNIKKHMTRSVNQQVFDGGDNPWMSGEMKRLYNMPFSKFVEQMLRPETIDMTVNELTAVLTADAQKAS